MSDKFRKLTDYEHARLRIEMYLGSKEPHTANVFGFNGSTYGIYEFTWIPSIYVAIRELIDNSLDEVLAHGFGDSVWVSYNPEEMLFTVEDNGRGLPIDEKKELGKGPAASILLGEARAGRNFDERGTVAGLNGIGASITNFTSSRFDLTIYRDNKKFTQEWTEGVYGKKEIHKTNGPTIKPSKSKKTGTKINFVPSTKVWGIQKLPEEFLVHRLWDIVLTNPKLKLYYNGVLLKSHGRKPMVDMVFGKNVGIINTKSDRVEADFYVQPYDGDEHVHSLVNSIPVFEGGSHIIEFKNLFYNALIDILEPMVKKAIGKAVGKNVKLITKQDVAANLIIYNVTKMIDPHFNGQTKERLSSEIKTDIRSGFDSKQVNAFVKNNPDWITVVIDRCSSRIQKSQLRDVNKEQKRLDKTKVVALRDATGKNRQNCILFITEGLSATAGLLSARNAKIHGALPLKGKVMNVFDVSPKKALESEALRNMMSSIGLKIGDHANRLHLRYGKIYICTDADQDGKNISALLVNFFYRFWPELFNDHSNPFIYDMDTPLVILKKGKTRKYIYADKYDSFNPTKYKGWSIIRAKGLARLEKPDWEETLKHPKLFPIIDDAELKETLSLIFDNARADDRKVWLTS